jgi:hypothetical protein
MDVRAEGGNKINTEDWWQSNLGRGQSKESGCGRIILKWLLGR